METAEYIIEKNILKFKKEIVKKKALFGLITTSKNEEVTVNKARTGYCIRTKSIIPLNINRPYSNAAYDSWNQYKNKTYKEKYCHGCGKEHTITFAKPFCIDCFKKV